MTGIVSIPSRDGWQVANWAYRRLMADLLAGLELDEDRHLAERSEAFQHLDFDAMDRPTAARFSKVLAGVAGSIRSELLEGGSTDPRDSGFAAKLDALERDLDDVYGATWT